MSKMVHASRIKRHVRHIRDFISLACKFNALEKKSHSLFDDPRACIFAALHRYNKTFHMVNKFSQEVQIKTSPDKTLCT